MASVIIEIIILLHIARPDENKSKDESTFVKSVNSSSSATSEASNACTMTRKGGKFVTVHNYIVFCVDILSQTYSNLILLKVSYTN